MFVGLEVFIVLFVLLTGLGLGFVLTTGSVPFRYFATFEEE